MSKLYQVGDYIIKKHTESKYTPTIGKVHSKSKTYDSVLNILLPDGTVSSHWSDTRFINLGPKGLSELEKIIYGWK